MDKGTDPDVQGDAQLTWNEAESQRALALIEQLAAASSEADAATILALATRTLGAEVSQFTSVIRDDGSLTSYRVLHAGDPGWASEYGRMAWWQHDPWLRYAFTHAEPICGSTFVDLNAEETQVRDAARAAGFVHMLVIPSPSTAAQSRVGVLCLGSRSEGFLAPERIPALRSFGRALAMELSDWVQRFIRAQLMERAKITEADLILLRHEQQGHGSKQIAAMLGIEPKTVDCRFRRLAVRMGTGTRRAAARMAELYGLL
jgi:DNA-binding CsgD family transcriptional regulator